MQDAAAAASQASAAALTGLKSHLDAARGAAEHAAKRQKADGDMYNTIIENLSQQNTSLAGEASKTQAALFEAALEKLCARLHNMQLIVLLNNIRNVVVKSPDLTRGINGASEVKKRM